ncbi:YbdD/YjiX family protein [Glaciihabitans tibetensis]|nr:YbdD/YjiX family protein [Glaciihabitans tibetensis]
MLAARAAARLRAIAQHVSWYVSAMMGDDAYRKYREHHESQHRDDDSAEPMLTEKQFWRDQTDRQDTNPQGRCC